ncbi:MAG: tRNA/rRNA methyltransferase YfiF, partial [Hafnia sp.]
MNDSFNGKNGKVKVMYVRSEDDSKDRDQKSRPEGKGRQGERGGRQGRSAQDGDRRNDRR